MDRPGWTASARATGLDQFRFLVFNDPAWNVQRFNFDTDIVRAEEADGGTINALDPNLKPFIDRGGKLIQYHGWSDPQISPVNSTQVLRARRRQRSAARPRCRIRYRLFMAPGMGHCGGGEGPNTFDMVARARAMGGARQGARSDRRVARRRRSRRSHAAALPVSRRLRSTPGPAASTRRQFRVQGEIERLSLRIQAGRDEGCDPGQCSSSDFSDVSARDQPRPITS